MSRSIFRKISSSKPPGLFVIVAAAAFALSFALTYIWARQRADFHRPAASLAQLESNKDQDGLVGPVNSVRTETAKLSYRGGNLAEGQRELMELTTYDTTGKRVESAYYLVSGNSRPGREEYAYDNQGHIIETTVRDDNNAILSKEINTYEYDAVGNWTRMITSKVVYDGGKLARQPAEVTYRKITYYFDQAISEIVKPNSSSTDVQNIAGAQGDVAALRATLNEWIATTNTRDIDRLMDFYDSTIDVFYRVHNVSREFVRAEKLRLFRRADRVEVQADAPEITLSGDDNAATMRFRKQYVIQGKGLNRRGEVLQQLQWQRTREGWKIVGERDVQVIR